MVRWDPAAGYCFAAQAVSELAAYVPLHKVEVVLAKHRVKGSIGDYASQSGITWKVFEEEATE